MPSSGIHCWLVSIRVAELTSYVCSRGGRVRPQHVRNVLVMQTAVGRSAVPNRLTSAPTFSRLATFRRGDGAFTWTPHGPGLFTVSVAAKELRTGLGKRDRDGGEIEVENRPG